MSNLLKPTLLGAALLTGALGLVALPAQAQSVYRSVVTGPNGEEEVIVNAPREWMHRGPGDTIALSREVSYGDLDLTTRGGARELRQRVRATSRDVCEELSARTDRSSLGPMDLGACERDAYRDAMSQAHDAVRQARYSADDDYGYDER